MRVALLLLLVAALLTQVPAVATLRAQEGGSSAASALDYEFFKTKVQPIFLAKRDGHTRCVSCHSKRMGVPLLWQETQRVWPPGTRSNPGGTSWLSRRAWFPATSRRANSCSTRCCPRG